MLSPLGQNAAVSAITKLLDGGSLTLHGRNGQRIVELPLSAPAFTDPVDGAAEARPIGQALAVEDGDAVAFALTTAAGEPVFRGLVGKELTLNQTAVAKGATVTISAYTLKIRG